MSKSTAKQEHLITPTGFILLVFFVIAMMVLLYPSKEALFSGDKSSDDLKSLFKNPDKLKYEQTLAQTVLTPREVLTTVEELSEKGLWKEARHLLTEKLPKQLDDTERREAALWMLQSHLDEYYISQHKGKQIDRPLGGARAQLQRFEEIEKLSLEELRLLAKSSLEFGLIPQAIQTYFRLAVIDPSHALDWLDQAGVRAMQIHYYSDAVKAYKWANKRSKTAAEKKTYLYAWLDAANKAGHSTEVADLISDIEADLPSDPLDLEKLAKISLEIGRPSIAHRLYARLAEVDSTQAKYWYEKAGVWALSNKEYPQAADYFAQTEKLTSNPEEIERLQYKQYEIFTAAEMPKKALQKIQPIVEKHRDDQTLLQKGINTALAAKATPLARQWNARYLQSHPNDISALQLQSDIEIRDKHYDQAIVYVKRLLALDKKHLESHKKLAFLLETQGDDVEALQEWQLIQQLDTKTTTDQGAYQQHILRLAQATLPQGGLAFLLNWSQTQKLPEQTVQDIASYYLSQKSPAKAQQFLRGYIKQHPASLALWQRLVSLQQKQPQLALATWETIEQQFGANDKTRLARIEILWGLEHKQAVLAIYDAQPNLPINSPYHHQIIAELMWTFKRFDTALVHYKQLLQQANKQDSIAYYQRIIAIHLERKQYPLAFKNLHTAWDKTQDSGFLLNALQVAFTHHNSQELQYFQSIAHKNESLFATTVDYWQLQAQISAQTKDYVKTLAHYQTVLRLKSTSIAAKQGILWVYMQTKQKKALANALIQWQTLAAKQDKLWASYALAYQSLGETQKSLPWYQHYINKHRDDFTMLLGYAEQLDKLQRHDSAYRIRQRAVSKLQQALHKNNLNKAQRKEALFQYLSMVQRYGSEKEFSSLQKQLTAKYLSKADQSRLNEIAIAWFLGRKLDEKLRYQLTQAHEARLKTPLWQLLAIAIKDKDKAAIDKLLVNAKDIRLEEKVLALIASNKTRRAYQLALSGIDAKRSPKDRAQARQLALSLANDHASSVKTTVTQKQIGTLNLQSIETVYRRGIKGDLPLSYDLSVKRNRLNYGDLSETEIDLSAGVQWQQGQHRVETKLGVNQNKQDSVYYAKGRYQYQFSDDLNAAVEIGKNEISSNGALLRYSATRDRVKADVNAHLGNNNYLSASVWEQAFSSRKGEKLASGKGLSASLIHREKMGSAQWHLGLQAQLEKNQTEPNLPNEIVALNGSQSIVINNPKSMGLILGINHGNPAKGVPSVNSPRYSADAWLGKSWPTGKITSNIEASIGSRILGNDELSATAFVNGVSGSNGQTDQGIKIQYQKWFDIGAK